ncbi:hypothetical protein ACJMK2_003951 [Sinanodonta woodiana]|uniref:C-type lectin domain-containing protein n=1 Tax=Sinanodonta woodiana TaxID=1069815 RepID=A0ABD3Y1B9_SINWO
MNILQIGFAALTLLAFANGFMFTSGGGFGGISGILSVLLLLIFIGALGKKTNTCPGNYTPTPNDPTSCILFISDPTKNFNDAYTVCGNDGGHLLKLSTASFPIIQQLTRNNSGLCDFWVQTIETADGSWSDANNVTTPTTPGLFFFDDTNGDPEDCGIIDRAFNFFVRGTVCTESHCFICQKDI